MEETTQNLEVELEETQDALENDESINIGKLAYKPSKIEAEQDMEASKSVLLEKLEIKKQELVCCLILISYCLSSSTFFAILYIPKHSLLTKSLSSSKSSMEDTVRDLEKRWAGIQDKALKQPSPGIFNWSSC